MKSKTITVNDIEIVAHSDGSITKPFHGKTKRTFGYKDNHYMRIKIGSKMFLMHRLTAQAFLDNFLDYPQVDHIDANGFNNDARNLRMATNLMNSHAGRRKAKGCSSQYIGATWCRNNKKWKAQCMINGKNKNLGLFESELDAAIARDRYCYEQGMPKEKLNFPENYA